MQFNEYNEALFISLNWMMENLYNTDSLSQRRFLYFEKITHRSKIKRNFE